MEQAQPTLSRRTILVAGGATAAGVAALVVAAPSLTNQGSKATGSTSTRDPLIEGEIDQWTAQIGSTFTTGGGYALKLVGVQPLQSEGARPRALRDSAFAAVFDLTQGTSLPGDLIYVVSHPRYGPMQMFLSATGSPSRMLAVFN